MKRVEIAAVDDKRRICMHPGWKVFADATDLLRHHHQMPSKRHSISNRLAYFSFCKSLGERDNYNCLHPRYYNSICVGLGDDHCALVLFDVFKGQCTPQVFKLLDDDNILYVTVSSNCTDRLQPLDVSINKPANDF